MDILELHDWPTLPHARHELFVAEAVTLKPVHPLGLASATVYRRPSGSVAEFEGLTFTPDKPGRWVFELKVGQATRLLKAVAFDPAVMSTAWLVGSRGWERSPQEVRIAVRGLISNPHVTDEALDSWEASGRLCFEGHPTMGHLCSWHGPTMAGTYPA